MPRGEGYGAGMKHVHLRERIGRLSATNEAHPEVDEPVGIEEDFA